MHRGFIPLHRKLKDHWLYKDNDKLAVWIKILIETNHKSKKEVIGGDLIDCNRGQSINSLNTWSNIFGKKWTPKKVKTFFKLLQSDSMIVYEGLRKTSRITICNYESYNSEGNTEVTEKSHRGNSKVKERSTNNNDNNAKNVNNDNNKIITPLEDLFNKWWTQYGKKGNRKNSLSRWIKLSDKQRKKCSDVVDQYVLSTPDKQFRKGGESYLNLEAFEDEIFIKENANSSLPDVTIKSNQGRIENFADQL